MVNHTLLQAFHVFVVGLFLVYMGIARDNAYKPLFKFTLLLGVFIIGYHLYRAYEKGTTGKSYWVNLVHILLVGPLLVYVGYNGVETSRKYFELMLMLGFSAIGYHGYYLLSELR